MMRDETIERRLARIESRLVTLMIHLGLDPYERMYDAFRRSNQQNLDTEKLKLMENK